MKIKATQILMSFLSKLLRIFNTLIPIWVNKHLALSIILKFQKTANKSSSNRTMKKKNSNKRRSNKLNKSSLRLNNCRRNHNINSNNKIKPNLKLIIKTLFRSKYSKRKSMIHFNLKPKAMSSLKFINTNRQLISILKDLGSLILNSFMEPHKRNVKKWLK